MKDVVLEPQEILALYASPNQVEKGETVMLGDIKSQNQVANSADILKFMFHMYILGPLAEHLHRGGDDVPAGEVGGGGSGSAGEAEVGLGLEGIRGRGGAGGGPQAGKRGKG